MIYRYKNLYICLVSFVVTMSKKVVSGTIKKVTKPLNQPAKIKIVEVAPKAPKDKVQTTKAQIKTSQIEKDPAKSVTKIVTEVFSDIIEEEFSYCEQEKRTTPYMSQYEYCALISARIAQLTSRSAEWNIPKIKLETSSDYDPLKIATKEVQARLVSLVIRRKLPDGTTEDWSLKDMIFPRI